VNSNISKEEIHNFINKLDVNNNIKKELLKITPENYTGI
jgi:adenylosuccinate lyase